MEKCIVFRSEKEVLVVVVCLNIRIHTKWHSVILKPNIQFYSNKIFDKNCTLFFLSFKYMFIICRYLFFNIPLFVCAMYYSDNDNDGCVYDFGFRYSIHSIYKPLLRTMWTQGALALPPCPFASHMRRHSLARFRWGGGRIRGPVGSLGYACSLSRFWFGWYILGMFRFSGVCVCVPAQFWCWCTHHALQKHRIRILHALLEVLQPLSANGTVHRAMITAERHRNVIALLPALLRVLVRNDAMLGSANGQNARLRRIDDGAELGDAWSILNIWLDIMAWLFCKWFSYQTCRGSIP